MNQKAKNIFEAASQIERERREKEKPEEPLSAPQKGSSLDEIFRRCHQMHEEITESLDRAFKQAGVTPSQLRTFVSKPRNFSSGDWNKVEEGKKQSEKMLTELKTKIGTPSQTVPAKPAAPPKPAPEAPSKQSPPKKRARVVTKRQWIGM